MDADDVVASLTLSLATLQVIGLFGHCNRSHLTPTDTPLTLSLTTLQRRPKKYHRPSWFHFYGAPPITDQWPALPGCRIHTHTHTHTHTNTFMALLPSPTSGRRCRGVAYIYIHAHTHTHTFMALLPSPTSGLGCRIYIYLYHLYIYIPLSLYGLPPITDQWPALPGCRICMYVYIHIYIYIYVYMYIYLAAIYRPLLSISRSLFVYLQVSFVCI